MKIEKWLLWLVCVMIIGQQFVYSQVRRPRELRQAYVAPDEAVSLARTTPFSQAMDIFNIFSKKFLNKIIIDTEEHKYAIDVDIDKMQWLEALETVLRKHQLWYQEYPEYIKITSGDGAAEKTEDEGSKKGEVDLNTREVIISAVFFEADGSLLQQMGLSWDFFRAEGLNLGARMAAAENKTGTFQIDFSPELDFGSLLSVFKAMETDQLGEVVASPQITVQSGQLGRIQVGSDVGVTIKDFAGNSVTQFFSTGSIINVTPTVFKKDSVTFINLDLRIERSNTANSTIGLEIKRSSAQTRILLLDGEETVIGGLYVNEEVKSREGVPLLKNIPWWFFGLRYLFGYDGKSVIKKELIIMLKADLVPTLSERVKLKVIQSASKKRIPTLMEKRLKFRKDMEFYKQQSKPIE
jgi:hypothetical protein